MRNPRDRMLPIDCRRFDVGFAFANYLWTLTPGADPKAIVQYNRRGSLFLDSTGVFQCAIPHRITGGGSQGKNLLVEAMRILREDPSSRRAIVPIITPEDLWEEPRDFPCVSSVQMFIRSRKLHMVVHMRSQSLVGVLPYDLFLFTLLQESVALQLDVDLGEYQHICNSLHVYEDEFSTASDLLKCEAGCVEMNVMVEPNPLSSDLHFRLERDARSGCHLSLDDLPMYWQHLHAQLRLTLQRNQL